MSKERVYWQKKLKCKGCLFCEEEERKKGKPCCTYLYKFKINIMHGKCLTRKSRGY